MRLLCLFLLTFWQLPATADIIFSSSPVGASEYYNFNPSNPKLVQFQIVGGITSRSCLTSAGTGTCNTCLDSGDNLDWIRNSTTCNDRQVFPTTELILRFSSTSAVGSAVISTTLGGGQNQPLTQSFNALPTTGPNQTIEVRVPWNEICSRFIDGTPSCMNSGGGGLMGNQVFQVGIDGDSDGKLTSQGTTTNSDDYVSFTIYVMNVAGDPSESFKYINNPNNDDHYANCKYGGLCNFSLYPGDEKANLEKLTIQPSNGSRPFKNVIFFCTSVAGAVFNDIANPCTAKVSISGANALANNTIKGMPNGTETLFRAASVDIAGNYGPFLNIDSDEQKVTPDAVFGVLDENSCFIATAAYGSPMEKHVKVLRAFRDRVLLQSTAGKFFVKTYYTLSPPLAQWIAQTSERRSITRTLLTPVVFMASSIMTYPLHFGLLWITSIMGFFFWIRHRKEQQI